jgi:hypothetical protein
MNGMATAAPEDHDEIHELQATLRRALADWDAAGPDKRDTAFAQLVPAADDLVEAKRHQLQTRAAIKADRIRDWAGRILLMSAALLVGALALFGAGMWWALLALPLLGIGLYLQIPGRNRG